MSFIHLRSQVCWCMKNKYTSFVLCKYASSQTNTPASDRICSHADIAKERICLQLKSSLNIPKKKSWSSTAVLEALEKTVGSAINPPHDYVGSPHYFGGMIPDRKDRLLSYEKGIEAAEYVIKNNPQYFIHDFDADDVQTWLPSSDDTHIPAIEGESDESVDTENVTFSNSSSSLESLDRLIIQNKVVGSVVMFKRLVQDKVEIPVELINKFLGFITFYRGDPSLPLTFAERPHTALIPLKLDDSMSPNYEEIISLIEDPTADQYCTMIRGLASRGKRKEAFAIYEEKMKPADMPVDLETYNSLIFCASGNPNKPTHLTVQELCREMQRNGISPNHQTFINYATIPARFNRTAEGVLQHAHRIINEMQYLGLQPCISIYNGLYRCVSTSRQMEDDEKAQCLSSIIDLMAEQSFLPVNPKDVIAFDFMMSSLRTNLLDAKKLFSISKSGTNGKLFRSSKSTQQFYQTYLSILMEYDTMENIWIAFNEIIPLKMAQTFRLIENLLTAVRKHKAPEYLPVIFAEIYDSNAWRLQSKLFRLSVDLVDDADNDTRAQFKNIASLTLNSVARCNNREERDTIVNQCIQLSCHLNDRQHLCAIIEDLVNNHSTSDIQESTLNMCRLQCSSNDLKLQQVVEKLSSMVRTEEERNQDKRILRQNNRR